MGKKCILRFAVLSGLVIGARWASGFGDGISQKEFFERLEKSFQSIQTFQADVEQQTRFPDGVVQIYSGKLAVSDDQRIAYDYELTGEFKDESSISPTDPPENPPAAGNVSHPVTETGGAYRTQGNRVIHHLPDQGIMVESPENENLLIQLFRSLIGSGEFDLEAFKEEHKILGIQEKELDGVPILGVIAQPKKKSKIYQKWAANSRNPLLEWKQELWVKKESMEPVSAVLHSTEESTSVILRNVRINEPVDPRAFLLSTRGGGPPVKLQQGTPPVEPQWIESQPIERPLQEIPLESPVP